ncbi:hypothetical protein TOPH_03898 [Tolypocladium ophioglossoides CBS 100239]|uniref:SRR1-like domain-containing protein n=1 Tax=Tolypocladium ophioglossoides (strain CBS 100239) TaxID=1163406 RepID=A0A0L0NCH2_TOLOC|nr:hypothetical protein TOPH_03898 [Tolypocladium ophioglossoides CBS 100239]
MAPPSPASTPDDEWTFVQPKKTRRANALTASIPPPRTGPLRAVPDIAAEYRAAVCLGIGTFDPADGSGEARRRTYVQLIAFLVMVDELEKNAGGEKLPCFFQEPIFTASDRSFIASLGHRVVDSPAACERVDRSTLIFGVHLYRPVYALALKNGPPAVFVGTGWDVWDRVSLAEEPHDLASLKVMEQTYGKAAFPQDALGTAFSSTSVYWRRAASEEAVPAAASREGEAHAQDDLADKLASVSIT